MTVPSIIIRDKASAREQLKEEVNRLKGLLTSGLPGVARIELMKPDSDESSWSRAIKVVPSSGKVWVEVEVSWSEDDAQAEVDVSTSSSAAAKLGVLPLVAAAIVGFVADQHPEWLPVLRGIRVGAGAVVGFIIGLLLLVVVQKALGMGASSEGRELEARVTQLLDSNGA
jgi:hypothetical protein